MADVQSLMTDLSAGMDSSIISNVLKISIIYIGALWIALIVWVTRDVINRSNNIVFQVCIISLNIFFPIFGLLIYLIIRPTETLMSKYYQDLEYKTLLDFDGGREQCEKCQISLDKEYLFCPDCGLRVKKKCTKCRKPYSIEWALCPYCGVKSSSKRRKTTKRATARK